MEQVIADTLFIGRGALCTLELLLGGLLIGTILGTLLSILRYNNVASFLINQWVSVVRGTPLLLQLSLIYFTFPSLLGIKVSVVVSGIIAFGINSSAYIAEIDPAS